MTISEELSAQLTALREQQQTHEQALAELTPTRDQAIRDALAAGAGITELARLAGLSRVSIYAIRDRRR